LSLRERFEEIYSTDEWYGGSGEGSQPKYARSYVAFLQQFMRDNAIRTVADLGCGDWQFSRLVDWSGVEYDGYEVVRPVLADIERRFSAPHVRFHLIEGEPSEVADADLLLVKDVFQHWSHARIHAFLPHLSRFRCALITNCAADGNEDIPDGGYRALDLRRPPFEIRAESVHEFFAGPRQLLPWRPTRRTHKRVLLVRSR
jgi:hypothetical protein